MVFQVTRKIMDRLKVEGLKCRVLDLGDSSAIELGIRLRSGTGFMFQFISTDEGNDIALRVFDVVAVPDCSFQNVLLAINELNRDYRYAKFVLIHQQKTVQMEMDVPKNTQDVSSVSLELLHRGVQILEDAYPRLLKAVTG